MKYVKVIAGDLLNLAILLAILVMAIVSVGVVAFGLWHALDPLGFPDKFGQLSLSIMLAVAFSAWVFSVIDRGRKD